MHICKNGHDMTNNMSKRKTGQIVCRTCDRERSRKRQGYQGNLPTGQRTHCPQGHEYSLENTYINNGSRCARGHEYDDINTYFYNGMRQCIICRKIRKGKIFGPSLPRFTHCKYGHEFNIENTSYAKSGKRVCLACHRVKQRNRREVKMLLDGNYSIADEQYTRDLFDHKCFKCSGESNLSIDHHYPLSAGFGLSQENAVLLCRSCNSSKNNRLPEDFYSNDELQILSEKYSITSQLIIC
jgi:5-methylcytosine-specific restriction endonuclease McrA